MVSAGALGFIIALTQPTPADLAREIAETRELTAKPFAGMSKPGQDAKAPA